MSPTADHYARALVEAAKLTGETAQLQALTRLSSTGAMGLRNIPLKARPLAWAAMKVRFPGDAFAQARVLGLGSCSAKILHRHRSAANRIARAI